MKRYIKSNIQWNQLSGSDQMAIEYAIRYYESGDYDIEDAVYKACDFVSFGNAEPEYANEPFYQDEPDYDKVLNYMISRYEKEL